MQNKLSIKELANSLKNPSAAKEQTAKAGVDQQSSGNIERPEKAKEGVKKEGKKEKLKVETSKKKDNPPSSLMEEIEISNQRDDYNLTKAVHIDGDVHEVFTKLKAAGKLKIGKFLSYKLEMLILEHQQEILEIINSNNNKNKFLDK